jgi:NADH-quinone oxidoreductase subunit M
MFGPCDNPKNQVLKYLNFREVMTLVPLIIWAFWIGLYPKPFFKVLDKPVAAIVERVNPDFYRPAASATLTLPTQSKASAAATLRSADAGLKAGAASPAPQLGGVTR